MFGEIVLLPICKNNITLKSVECLNLKRDREKKKYVLLLMPLRFTFWISIKPTITANGYVLKQSGLLQKVKNRTVYFPLLLQFVVYTHMYCMCVCLSSVIFLNRQIKICVCLVCMCEMNKNVRDRNRAKESDSKKEREREYGKVGKNKNTGTQWV